MSLTSYRCTESIYLYINAPIASHVKYYVSHVIKSRQNADGKAFDLIPPEYDQEYIMLLNHQTLFIVNLILRIEI